MGTAIHMSVLFCLKLSIKTSKSHLKKKTNLNKVFLKIVMVLLNYWTSWCWFLHSPVTCSRHTDDLGRLLTLWYRIQVHSQITPILNKPKQLKIHSLSLYLTVTVFTVLVVFIVNANWIQMYITILSCRGIKLIHESVYTKLQW